MLVDAVVCVRDVAVSTYSSVVSHDQLLLIDRLAAMDGFPFSRRIFLFIRRVLLLGGVWLIVSANTSLVPLTRHHVLFFIVVKCG